MIRARDAEDSVNSAEDSASVSSSSSESESDYSMADTDAEDVVKSAKVPQFDGTTGKFQMWWMRFTVHAMLQKFAAALKETAETHLPRLETEGPNETEDNKKARKRNTAALYNLTLAFTTESLMSLLFKAQTTAWPNGLAHLVVKELFKKFQPRDTISRVELRSPAQCSEHGQEGQPVIVVRTDKQDPKPIQCGLPRKSDCSGERGLDFDYLGRSPGRVQSHVDN